MTPSGSSGFADDSTLHTAGPDAIPSMRILVSEVGPFIDWLGLYINMKKSFISAIDFSTNNPVATDSITLHGVSFITLLPDQPHKHLGVRITMTGDFGAEKKHVHEKMQRRIAALLEDDVLLPSLKEMVMTLGVVLVFRYSAGVVPWTRCELETMYTAWISAYKQMWLGKAGRSADGSPMIIDPARSGRNCPSPLEVLVRDVQDLCV